MFSGSIVKLRSKLLKMEVLKLFPASQSPSLTEETIMITFYWKIEQTYNWTEINGLLGLCPCSWNIRISRLNAFSFPTRLSGGLTEYKYENILGQLCAPHPAHICLIFTPLAIYLHNQLQIQGAFLCFLYPWCWGKLLRIGYTKTNQELLLYFTFKYTEDMEKSNHGIFTVV